MKRIAPILILALALAGAFAAEPSAIVKFRRLELKVIQVKVTGTSQTLPFLYSEMLKQVMLAPSPRGSNADEMIKVIAVWAPIKRAIELGKADVLLDQPGYDLVLQKLNDMAYSPPMDFVEPVVGFITYVRGLKEEEFDANPKTAPPAKP